jgi:hypothetical protein
MLEVKRRKQGMMRGEERKSVLVVRPSYVVSKRMM